MLVFSSLAAVMFSQAALGVIETPYNSVEVEEAAFEELASNDYQAAAEQLEQLRDQRPDDPAVLINLAAAYVALGRLQEASDAYVAAIASRDHQLLELANGDWGDSRDLARDGLQRLQNSQAWAMK